MKEDIAEKKQRCAYLGLQIRDREAELGTVLKKLQTTSSLGKRPEKGVLGYRSDDVENYVEAAEAKDRIRQITRTQTDDLPARKAMWDQLEKQKPLLAEYYSLINDPDALIRKAQEVKDAQLRNTMYALAKAALGGNWCQSNSLTRISQQGGSVSLWELLNSVANIVLFIFFLMEGCLVQIRLP